MATMKRLTTMRTLRCPCCEEDILVDVTHYLPDKWKDTLGEQFTTVHVVPIGKENLNG